MLVLDLAGDYAERPVGDVPSERAAELPGVKGPDPSIDQRDRRLLGCAMAIIECRAEPVDLPPDAGDAPACRAAAPVKDEPKIIRIALPPVVCRKAFGNGDGAVDRLGRDPFRELAARSPMLVDRAVDREAFDHPVGTECARHTARAHRLTLAVAHAGQIGA